MVRRTFLKGISLDDKMQFTKQDDPRFYSFRGDPTMFEIEFDAIVFQEGKTYVAYSPKLDVSSCGSTVEEAKNNLKTAVRLFIEECDKMGSLDEILGEAGYESTDEHCWKTPRMVATELVSLQAQ